MGPEDVERVGELLRDSLTEPWPPIGFPIPSRQPEHTQESVKESTARKDDYPASQRPESLSPEALFLEGKNAGAIVTELTGMTSKNGKLYLIKLAEVQAVLRDTFKQWCQAASCPPSHRTCWMYSLTLTIGSLMSEGRGTREPTAEQIAHFTHTCAL